jgi:FixJ family two-component response regulator
MAPATPAPVVYVVDDDTDVLGSLRFLLETDGFDVRTFRVCAESCDPMRTITAASERIDPWSRMRRFLARFSERV